ncbi:flagellar motor protein MotB [Actinoplanes sp. NPDC051633]|uniref:flagellar motor protein MotB n=1 Tax=Actinoplanes sp. NPDC051633 TaxID=3155670 RepID=UPI00343D036C
MSSGSAKKKKGGHEEHEEHVNHERWLVSYADMLTLLFVLFVVLFSMSSVDQKKFAELAAGLSEGFGAESAAFTGSAAQLDGSGNATQVVQIDAGANPSDGATGTANMSEKEKKAVEAALKAKSRAKASKDAQAATKEVENLKEIERKVAAALVKAKLQDQVKFTINERGLIITVVTNEVVFDGGDAKLRSGGEKILNAIAPALAKLPNNIEVDGHTNQLKATTGQYPSGWELSAARASTVVRHLTGDGLAKDRMSAVGFSDTKPLINPTDPKSVQMNRRVDVVVLTQLTAEQAALLPAAAGDDAKLHAGATTSPPSAEQTTGTTTTTASHD